MKLADLPLRDQIAIAALSGILSRPNITDGRRAARSAYRAADGMLLRMMVNDHEIKELTQRAEKAEIALEVLRTVHDETMQTLRDLSDGIKVCLGAERARLTDLKPGSPASTYTAKRIENLERLVK